ncbi:hypothetical protein ABIE65_002035 [Constrictibacter sp. MBR-5]|uniref:hypothetical protein n=1 Tax=Constrictibacter sp. MBR-5 TaxID=3156467 RepID=UPI00339B11F5
MNSNDIARQYLLTKSDKVGQQKLDASLYVFLDSMIKMIKDLVPSFRDVVSLDDFSGFIGKDTIFEGTITAPDSDIIGCLDSDLVQNATAHALTKAILETFEGTGFVRGLHPDFILKNSKVGLGVAYKKNKLTFIVKTVFSIDPFEISGKA